MYMLFCVTVILILPEFPHSDHMVLKSVEVLALNMGTVSVIWLCFLPLYVFQRQGLTG